MTHGPEPADGGIGILCLLPVRNGGEHLRRWLADAPQWCDAVVALDDGSTDDTRALLDAAPIVVEVIANPVRASAAGWDDGANRRALLAAAARHRPAWIVWVDADERIAPDDAAALREFVAHDALPGIAYGLLHCRMWHDDSAVDAYDPRTPWVYRLFAWRPDLELAAEWLHFNPVPVQIPRRAWIRTSIRLQHFGATDESGVHARVEKYAAADPEGIFPIDFGAMDRAPSHTVPWTARDPETPIVLGPDAAFGGAGVATTDQVATDRPLLAVLLPVRNGADELDEWFDAVGAVADVVIALDDGSTDTTVDVLTGHPLAHTVIRRPVRPDYGGWDDAANRQLLLDAAAHVQPQWVLYLDADERITADDAAALRAFLEVEATRGDAYGLRVHRMIGDDGHYDRDDLLVYRLFAWEPGLRLPHERLHFVPVPTTIPADRRRPTSIRIQHFASATAERRRRRFEKYRQADPDLEFQGDYGSLLDAPQTLSTWMPRSVDAPVLVEPEPRSVATERGSGDDDAADSFDLDAPVLSAIVIARDDHDRIARTLESVVSQELDVPFEVIAVVSGTDGTADVVRTQFPTVHLVDLGPGPALPGRARNAGLAVARGDYVSFPGSHIVLPPGSLAARVRAHELGYPMVTGSMRNANHTAAGWASYFLDHASVLPGSPSGELHFAPPHCSYDRELLVRQGGFPEDLRAGEDTVVNTALFNQGLRALRATDVELFHASPCTDAQSLVGHHFRRGRGLGRIMLDGIPPGGRVITRTVMRRTGIEYLRRRRRVTASNVARFGDDEMRHEYRRVRRLVGAGIVAAWLGTWWELLRPTTGKSAQLLGTPAVHVAITGLDRRDGFPVGRTDVLLLARIDVLRGRLVLLAPPRDLLVDVPGHGTARLNEAYQLGASALGGDDTHEGLTTVAETLRTLLGLRVDAVVALDFEGFVRLVDAVGGVDIDAEHAIDDDFVGEDGTRFCARFPAGPQHLDGASALTYARTRKADGDRWRRARHVELVHAIATSALASPRAARSAVGVARRSVITHGSSLRLAVAATGVARALRHRAVRTVELAAPAVRSIRIDDVGWVHVGDADAMERVLRDEFLR